MQGVMVHYPAMPTYQVMRGGGACSGYETWSNMCMSITDANSNASCESGGFLSFCPSPPVSGSVFISVPLSVSVFQSVSVHILVCSLYYIQLKIDLLA